VQRPPAPGKKVIDAPSRCSASISRWSDRRKPGRKCRSHKGSWTSRIDHADEV